MIIKRRKIERGRERERELWIKTRDNIRDRVREK